MDGWMLVGWLDDGWRMVGLGKERKKNMGNNDRGKIAMKKRKKKAKKKSLKNIYIKHITTFIVMGNVQRPTWW